MKAFARRGLAVLMVLFATGLICPAQQAKPGLLTAADLKQFVPSAYFFRGQSATVQLRNSGGFRIAPDKLVLAALVDTSGYSHDVQQKYQGLLITEVKLDIGGSQLAPGEYGFGFSEDGKFLVMDVGANDLFSVPVQTEVDLKRPVPLKMVEDGDGYRLYAGRKWVAIKPQ
jgi:hypothetical protein